jgi:hypothetical protein
MQSAEDRDAFLPENVISGKSFAEPPCAAQQPTQANPSSAGEGTFTPGDVAASGQLRLSSALLCLGGARRLPEHVGR